MKSLLPQNHRILLVDDNPTIHDDFRRVLIRDHSALNSIDAAAAAVLGSAVPARAASAAPAFSVHSAFQGEEALRMVEEACNASRPFALAFVDMRMPPGWDGLTTITKLWEVDPALQIVICTAFSDRSWTEIQQTLTARDRWMVVKKPFDEIEVLQLAHALTEKWNLARAADLRTTTLEMMVRARTDELERSNRVKNQFLANVSHEMLTPMNGIIGAMELLGDQPLLGEGPETLALARDSANRLLRLINQIFAFNRAEFAIGQAAWTECDVRACLEQALARFISRAQSRGLQLKVAIDPALPARVSLPVELVAQALGVLVDNAIKFTNCGEITIAVDWHAPARHALHFSVTDTGIGLSPAQLEWIRIPFAQVDGGNDRQYSGVGLGLPLVRRLLALIGTELQLQSKPGQGTRASFAIRTQSELKPAEPAEMMTLDS